MPYFIVRFWKTIRNVRNNKAEYNFQKLKSRKQSKTISLSAEKNGFWKSCQMMPNRSLKKISLANFVKMVEKSQNFRKSRAWKIKKITFIGWAFPAK